MKKKIAAKAKVVKKKPYVRPLPAVIDALQMKSIKSLLAGHKKGLLLTDIIEVFYFVANRVSPDTTIKMTVTHGR